MSLKENIIRLNILSGNQPKLQEFKKKHTNKMFQVMYRSFLLISDEIKGRKVMREIVKTMDCNSIPEERPVKLAAVVIAKNESDYIAEWIAYHKVQGFEKIYLYDNDSTDTMKECIQPFIDEGFVVYHQIHGNKQQGNAYTHALHHYGKYCKYMAFIDCDEFLTPCNYGDHIVNILDQFFKQHPAAGGLAVNWCMYGSSHLIDKPKGKLIDNFVWRAEIGKDGTQIIKSIVRPECCLKWVHPHYPVYRLGYDGIGFDGQIVPMWEHPIEDYEGVMICHYFTKSKNQWIKRRAMGQCSTGKNKPRPLADFYRHDNNDIMDERAKAYSADVDTILEDITKIQK